MGLSWGYTDPSQSHEDRVTFLRAAFHAGVRLFDTSDQYGPFTNEALVGEALEAVRPEVFLATKGGLVVDAERRTGRNGSPKYLREALSASLARLRTDYADLYQLHRVDPSVPLEHSWEALAALAEAGLTKQIGLSEVSIEEIERAQRIHPVASIQSELSLWSREPLAEVIDYCADHGITFIAYSPIGRGFLGGSTDIGSLPAGDWRRNNPRFRADAAHVNRTNIVQPLEQCAREIGATPAQVAIAWVLAQGDHIVTIPGTQRLQYLQQNLAAGAISIPEEWMQRLNNLPTAVGSRY